MDALLGKRTAPSSSMITLSPHSGARSRVHQEIRVPWRIGMGGRVSAEIGSPRFVGRDAELRYVTHALNRLPALILIEGEAGMGKSRLVREALASLGAKGPRPLVAVCPPLREALTLGPIVDAAWQAAPGVEALRGLGLSPLAGALRPLFPEWAAALPAAPPLLDDTGAAKHRLIRAFAELLDRLRIEVLVVEDVHWADEATLEFLVFLATRQPVPLSLLLTYRPEEVAADSLLLRLSARVSQGTEISRARISLGGLAVSDTAALVSSMLDGEQVSQVFAEFLRSRTEGVPLAVEECVRLMLDRADLVWREGEWGGAHSRRSRCRRRSGTPSPSGCRGWGRRPSRCCWRRRSCPIRRRSGHWGSSAA